MNNTEEERKSRLQKMRNSIKRAKEKKKNITDEAKNFLSFGKKVSKHWHILVAAGCFDLLGLIPAIGVLFNLAFGLILFLYFGPKKKSGTSELTGIVLPIFIGSIFDFFLGILPVNIGATLIRIALDKEK